MGNKYNILAKRIGIYHKDREWAANMGKQILDSMPDEAIESSLIYNGGVTIMLKDRTSIQFVYASECARGYRFSEAYIHKSVGWEEYRDIIAPKLTIAPYSAIMVENVEDFKCGTPANKWYELNQENNEE